MNNPESRKSLVEGLVAQDDGISETQLKEFRMNLEQSLESLELKAHSSRRATIRSLGVVTACYLVGFALQMIQNLAPLPFDLILPLWSFCTTAALITAVVIVVRYWSLHRPALERGRIDLQITMFGELQRQVSELNERLGGAGK